MNRHAFCCVILPAYSLKLYSYTVCDSSARNRSLRHHAPATTTSRKIKIRAHAEGENIRFPSTCLETDKSLYLSRSKALLFFLPYGSFYYPFSFFFLFCLFFFFFLSSSTLFLLLYIYRCRQAVTESVSTRGLVADSVWRQGRGGGGGGVLCGVWEGLYL